MIITKVIQFALLFHALTASMTYAIPCGENKGKNFNRIVGGVDANEGDFPWLISLQLFIRGKYKHICAGAIINSEWVLTAAHCVSEIPPKKLLVVAGKYQLNTIEGHEQNRTIVSIRINGYNNENYNNDIALLKLSKPFELNSEYITPICLPEGHEKFNVTTEVAGWGKLSEDNLPSDKLKKVALPLISSEKCFQLYEDAGYNFYLYKCILCTLYPDGKKDICQGDSGGPLMCYNDDNQKIYICGIISWGSGCARRDRPGVYTNVTCFKNWIIEELNKES